MATVAVTHMTASHHKHKSRECCGQLPIQVVAGLHEVVLFVDRVPLCVLLLG